MARKSLKTAQDIRRYVQGITFKLERGEIDASTAGKIGYLASICLKCVESSDFEKRLQELEGKVEEFFEQDQ